jgi:hypothetical protein
MTEYKKKFLTHVCSRRINLHKLVEVSSLND